MVSIGVILLISVFVICNRSLYSSSKSHLCTCEPALLSLCCPWFITISESLVCYFPDYLRFYFCWCFFLLKKSDFMLLNSLLVIAILSLISSFRFPSLCITTPRLLFLSTYSNSSQPLLYYVSFLCYLLSLFSFSSYVSSCFSVLTVHWIYPCFLNLCFCFSYYCLFIGTAQFIFFHLLEFYNVALSTFFLHSLITSSNIKLNISGFNIDPCFKPVLLIWIFQFSFLHRFLFSIYPIFWFSQMLFPCLHNIYVFDFLLWFFAYFFLYCS